MDLYPTSRFDGIELAAIVQVSEQNADRDSGKARLGSDVPQSGDLPIAAMTVFLHCAHHLSSLSFGESLLRRRRAIAPAKYEF
ncbi:hypothetical protein [Argonema galeatum]|uniref:hypothetical protein n=1 Tax=Argonema galeatum TaxID=2942762 RepID=UPI0020138F15|nr:hypothetical protein [Argonema galeatum]MCL1465774.1 hypothetical protein [Argonema galeatum A003/A1]